MTEAEWLAENYPLSVVNGVRDQVAPRRLALVAVDLLERVRHLLTDDNRRMADDFTRWVEGTGPDPRTLYPAPDFDPMDNGRGAAYFANRRLIDLFWGDAVFAISELHSAERWDIDERGVGPAAGASDDDYYRVREAIRRDQVARIRCIVGNPFRPVAPDPDWLTSTALGLAARIDAERAFDRLPILADALEEAGCDNADVLTHCRGPGPHVRGCWVVDLVLGKD